MRRRPCMLPFSLEPLLPVKSRVISCDRNHGHSASSIGTTADKLVIFVFVEIVLYQEQQCISIVGKNADSYIKNIIEIELFCEVAFRSSSSTNSNTFCGGFEAN